MCAGERSRIDLAYPELMIAIELDSWEYHGRNNLTAFTDDRAKKNDLIAKGWAAPSFTESMTDDYFVSIDPGALRRGDCVASGAA